MNRIASLAALCLWMCCCAGSATAADYFLTIGGGYSPTGNQISLEKNVLLYKTLLKERYPDGVAHDILFADGDDPGRDLQYSIPEDDLPRANLLLARIFQQTRYLGLRYRSHDIPNLRGASNRKNLTDWFDAVGSTLTDGDRLILYVTAHGGRSGDKKAPMNTTLYLWNGEKIQMQELAAELQKIPETVPVISVMVQCYSGGFANIVFENGDADAGVAAGNHVGFFATVHDRPAAGCTSDINEENYHEYSSYFWSAIRGLTRTDEPIDRPDYNEDGVVSFAEAHAYALLTSPTIDISVKTSDAFLRKYSRLGPAKEAEDASKTEKTDKTPQENAAGQAQGDAGPATPANEGQPPESETAPQLLRPESDFSTLRESVSPIDQAVLTGLSEQLKLTAENRAEAARELGERLNKEKKGLDGKIRQQNGRVRGFASTLSKAVKLRWPELANPWDPRVSEILRDESAAIVEFIERHEKYGEFEAARQELETLKTQRFDLDRKWVKTQRLLRALENAALEANLPDVATPEILTRYRELRAVEAGTLGPADGRIAGTVVDASAASEE